MEWRHISLSYLIYMPHCFFYKMTHIPPYFKYLLLTFSFSFSAWISFLFRCNEEGDTHTMEELGSLWATTYQEVSHSLFLVLSDISSQFYCLINVYFKCETYINILVMVLLLYLTIQYMFLDLLHCSFNSYFSSLMRM